MSKIYLRAQRNSEYEDFHHYFAAEFCIGDKPDENLSCNKIDNIEFKQALIEYKATHLPKPMTKEIAGILIDDTLIFTEDVLPPRWFKVV